MLTRTLSRPTPTIRSLWRPQRSIIPTRHYYNDRQQKINQAIKSALLNTTRPGTNYQGIPLRNPDRLPVRTIIFLIAASSSLTMMFYVMVQYKKFQDEVVENDGKLRKRLVFLPLWVNANFFYQKTYKYPIGLKYFDYDYYEYLMTEMNQSNMPGNGNGKKKKESDAENYSKLLQDENIKYSVLELLSANSKIRQLFGLPLNMELSPDDFKIWVESKYPSVSGLQIDILERSTKDGKSTEFNTNWIVKPINAASIVNDTLISLGLKLDRLERSDASIKTHEKASGKIHEVKLNDKVNLNSNRDYFIRFAGKFVVSDKSFVNLGVVNYTGTIDFDHLMINRGIKVIGLDLSYDGVLYKIL
ncbi:hypothetical protein Cantr_07603 [Candida viswanathii]|uniref:Altered inheritance of mitochondria protein 39, mitochondrial n=1 Tax=Candida viswanathii TaxID=5486 RepID=A0A367Y1M9_9ASCO|nr:hypothetical protein Cantr_07603 [Candida viswanathii]